MRFVLVAVLLFASLAVLTAGWDLLYRQELVVADKVHALVWRHQIQAWEFRRAGRPGWSISEEGVTHTTSDRATFRESLEDCIWTQFDCETGTITRQWVVSAGGDATEIESRPWLPAPTMLPPSAFAAVCFHCKREDHGKCMDPDLPCLCSSCYPGRE